MFDGLQIKNKNKKKKKAKEDVFAGRDDHVFLRIALFTALKWTLFTADSAEGNNVE